MTKQADQSLTTEELQTLEGLLAKLSGALNCRGLSSAS